MYRKLAIALCSCLVFSIVFTTIAYLLAGVEGRESYSFIDMIIITISYSILFYLLLGISFAYLIEFVNRHKQMNHFINSLWYIIAGMGIGTTLYLMSNDLIYIGIILTCCCATFTFFIVSFLFDKLNLFVDAKISLQGKNVSR